MSLKFDVKVRLDMKNLQQVKRRLIKAAKLQTQVGYFDGKPHPNQPDMTVAQIGAINEFGAPEDNIPERPFMATAVRNTRLAKPLADNLKRYLRRTQSLKGVWTAVGIVMARGISKTIAEFSDGFRYSPGHEGPTASQEEIDQSSQASNASRLF